MLQCILIQCFEAKSRVELLGAPLKVHEEVPGPGNNQAE